MALVKIGSPIKTNGSRTGTLKGTGKYDYEREEQRSLTSERYNRFLDPKEMTTFPRFDNHYLLDGSQNNTTTSNSNNNFHSPILKLKRNTPQTPYKGYYSDLQSIEQNLNEEPHPNLINSYLSQSFTSQNVTSFIETNVIRRHITFKERLADKLFKRHSQKLCRHIFHIWYQYSFRYVHLRQNLLVCYNMKYLSRRFYAWRYIAKISIYFRKCLKIYWKRVRRLYFKWWRIWTEWLRTKEKYYRETFRRFLQHTEYQLRIRSAWRYFIQGYYKDRCLRRIQKAYRWHRLRKLFWANRVIKKLFMDYFIIWLIRRRKRRERKRKLQEDLAVQQMIDRSDLYLRKYLQCRDGKAMTWTYLKEVNQLWDDRKGRMTLFPTKEEMPEIGMKWTVRGKAMHILRHRTIEEVSDWARTQFRSTCPPLYSCPRCNEVFTLKGIAREHKVNCEYVKVIPQYTCWNLCEGIVDAALKPLVALFYGKEAVARANKKEKEEIQSKQSDRLLHEALTGTPIRPEYEEVQTKPKKTDLRVF